MKEQQTMYLTLLLWSTPTPDNEASERLLLGKLSIAIGIPMKNTQQRHQQPCILM